MNPELRAKYEAVIGIECHVQLATKSKLFCGCDNDSREAPPNTHVCETCGGMPGSLPVLNKRAIELALRLGLALNAGYEQNFRTKFDRKNYFYPDLPSGYQITQFDEPIVPNGWIEFPVEGATMKVGITRAHLESDAGKLTHPDGVDYSLVDLNRAGTPLLEIVSEPDMRTPAEAKAYAQELYNLVRYTGTGEANLYYGNMRFDINVSVRPVGQAEFGTRTETKNLNSFRAIERTVEYEIRRQIALVENGERIRQETRGWNEAKQETYSMRSKEEADEYRYFPEPDLPPVIVTDEMIMAQDNEIGLLPADVRRELAAAGMPAVEGETLVADPVAAELWHRVVSENPADARFALNWLIGDRVKLEESKDVSLADSAISAAALVGVGTMVREGKLSSSNAKTLLDNLWLAEPGADSGAADGEPGADRPLDPVALAKHLGLLQESDEGALSAVIDAVIAANPQAVEDYRAGNARAFGALVGAAMKATQGKGNPPLINIILKEKLG